MNVTRHQRHQALDCPGRLASRRCFASLALEAEDAEVAPARGEISLGDLSYAFQAHVFILRGDCSVCIALDAANARRFSPRTAASPAPPRLDSRECGAIH